MRGSTWSDETTLVVDGVEFIARTTQRFESEPTRFCLVKNPPLARRYLELFAELRPTAMLELGVYQGGSTALAALVAEPEVLVAVELSPERVGALDTLLASRGIDEKVHLAYGVDQADAAAIAGVLEAAGVHGPVLDLVIDDASHLVDETRRSFDLLFPHLRPGGKYIIEDWSWAHIGFGSHRLDQQPLTTVVFELTMALPSNPGLMSSIEIDRDWAVITRGDGHIDPTGFSLSTLYNDRGRRLLASS
jgi:hypothetical protein